MEDFRRLEDRLLAGIAELEANVAELEELRELAARLGIRNDTTRDGKATRTATATRRARANAGRRTVTRTAAARQSTRRERVLEVVEIAPGITVREVVEQLGVNRTSLYPVVRQLVSDGLLHKDGKGLWPASR